MDKDPENSLDWYRWTDIPWIVEDYKVYQQVVRCMPNREDVNSQWLFGEFLRTFQL